MLDREILRLAIPALAAFAGQPLFLLADAAIVGHLGADALAGLSLASTILQTVIGLMIVLSFTATAMVSRHLGAGDQRRALSAGIDGLWVAAISGVILVGSGLLVTRWIVGMTGADLAVQDQAVRYLHWSLPGLPGMLAGMAATGILRGLQDTRTPLIVTVIGFLANIGLNYALVYGVGMGIAGSALGTSLAEGGMALAYLAILIPMARRAGASMRPDWANIRRASRTGGWLLVRTAALRIAMLATVLAATSLGTASLAAHQLLMTIFTILAFALDSLAVAGQALTGKELGAGNLVAVRLIAARLMQWGVGFGVITGILLAVLAGWIAPLFTGDPAVQEAFRAGAIVLALTQPLAGFVFVLDGVLIGAGDGKYLAIAGAITLLVYLPLVWAVRLATEQGDWGSDPAKGLLWLWAAFSVGYMGARAGTLWARARGDAWMQPGELGVG
jgi:putative MATE family efflux protein